MTWSGNCSRFLNSSFLINLPITVILHLNLAPLSSWQSFLSKKALMVENRPILDSCDTPLLFFVSALLFNVEKLFLETLCKLWRTAVYRLSLRSTTIGSKVFHKVFRHLSLASSSTSALFLADFCSHDVDDMISYMVSIMVWYGVVAFGLMHCHVVHESRSEKKRSIDRSIPVALLPVWFIVACC